MLNHFFFKPRHLITFLGILFVIAYWVPLKATVNLWLASDDNSYGFLIPLVSAYLLWETRKDLATMPIRSDWRFLPLLVLFTLVSLYGILGSSGSASMPAIPVILLLLTGFCCGTAYLKKVLLPLGFLIFMIPIPDVLERTLGMYLKHISTRMGSALIAALDIPVHVSGNVIDLGVTQLQVVDACNGLRYIFPLLALGIIYACFFQRTFWKRALCVFATIPIAIFMNAFRIGVTGLLVNSFGASAAEGFFHGFSGWILFLVAFALLFLMGRVLRLFPDRGEARAKRDQNPAESEGVQPPATADHCAFVISAVLLLTVAGLSWSTSALPALKLRGGMASFPLTFGSWKGLPQFVDPKIIDESGAEDAFSCVYTGPDGKQVFLYIGYRSTAFLANENFFHSPTVCLPSAGWKELSTGRHTISQVPVFGSLEVSEMQMENAGNRSVVYFWFQTKNKTTYDKSINRYHLAMHAIRRDNTHDLFIRPITKIGREESPDDATKRLDVFVHDFMPALESFLNNRQFKEN